MFFTSTFITYAVIFFVTLFAALYLYFEKKHKYWQQRGVYSPEGPKFLLSHFSDVVFLKSTPAKWMKKFYDQINKDFFGLYIFGEPFLIVKDSQLIKRVLVKDFIYFADRFVAPGDHDPYHPYILFFQKGFPWKHNRASITPALTSGKLKSMFPLFVQASDSMVDYLEKNQVVLEAKELGARYATEAISLTSFGIKAFSFEPVDSAFTINRRKLFRVTPKNAFAQLLYLFKPDWVPILRPNFFDIEALDYFSSVFMESMKMRTTKNPLYSDLIDIAKELRNNGGTLDDKQFNGHAFQFFIAGYETTSATISFALYSFALYPHIQEAVRKECNEAIEKYGGLTYEAVHDLPYLDMCVNETLRMYPVIPFLQRVCVQDYKIPNSDCVIEKNTCLFIPMYALHMDEKYFPDPHKFDPERFRNRLDQSNSICFLPFGEGPRNCMGERMGRMSTKLALISIIRNFEVTKCSKTPVPVVFEPKTFVLQSNVGLPIKFSKLVK
ncbi:unnamed protein product [Phyllotreta striolata]|uniref:Cytochrome P450 n=1 Tax=Phyllotreta striolata TaxID=444603 RepID=A0A9N9TKM9_PHYSR|nr:unnamed protein product [Phyllotreta striolata]